MVGDYTGETDRMDSWSQVVDAGGTGETDRMGAWSEVVTKVLQRKH